MHAQPHVEVLYINILVRSSLPLTPQQKTFLGSHFCNTTQYKNQRWQTSQTSIFQPSVLFLIWRQLLKYTCRLIVLMTGVLQKLPVTLDRFKFSDSYGYLSFLWPWKANAWPYKGILTNVKVWKYRYTVGMDLTEALSHVHVVHLLNFTVQLQEFDMSLTKISRFLELWNEMISNVSSG